MLCTGKRLRRNNALVVSTLILTALAVPQASSHDAPKGWAYPYSCCSGVDCRSVSKKAITERPQGYVITSTGEVVPYKDTRLHVSPDGEYHWCSVNGADNTRTICLFVPPRSF